MSGTTSPSRGKLARGGDRRESHPARDAGRTPSGEVVSVPNSTAAVCVNYSQEWSRAVVNLDIPMVGGESMEDLVHSVRATAEEALAEPDTATEVIGELEVLPATELTRPRRRGCRGRSASGCSCR